MRLGLKVWQRAFVGKKLEILQSIVDTLTQREYTDFCK